MTAEELRDRVREGLVELDFNHGWSADEWLIVVEGEGDVVLYVTFEEVEDTAGQKWPAICLDAPIFERVAVDRLPRLLGLNHDLVAGKLSLANDRLSLQHEIIGWPGAAEFRAALEIVLNHRAELASRLAGAVEGSPPESYSARAADAIARAQP